jgi:predicted permease
MASRLLRIAVILGCITAAAGFVQSYQSRRLKDDAGDRVGIILMAAGGSVATLAAAFFAKRRRT